MMKRTVLFLGAMLCAFAAQAERYFVPGVAGPTTIPCYRLPCPTPVWQSASIQFNASATSHTVTVVSDIRIDPASLPSSPSTSYSILGNVQLLDAANNNILYTWPSVVYSLGRLGGPPFYYWSQGVATGLVIGHVYKIVLQIDGYSAYTSLVPYDVGVN